MKWIEKKAKAAGAPVEVQSKGKEEKTGRGKVIDMMGLLKKSVQQAQPSTTAKKRKAASSRKSRKAS